MKTFLWLSMIFDECKQFYPKAFQKLRGSWRKCFLDWYFWTPPIIFHQILKMTILLFYTLMKWKYGDNFEKWWGGSKNTSLIPIPSIPLRSFLRILITYSTIGWTVFATPGTTWVTFYMYFETPPSTFSLNSKNDDFTVLYAYEMKIWW